MIYLRRLMWFRVGDREVHLPKLIGAFILTAALLMLVASIAGMFDKWDSVTNYKGCINSVDATLGNYEAQIQDCRDTLYNQTGLYLMVGQWEPTLRQTVQLLLEPIAWIMFWIAALLFGWVLYKSGDLILPIEQVTREVKERKSNVKRKK
ncbi:MAG: hypothetical protein ABIA76_01165 [Candidatus Diapherotrites archaeon]